MEKSKKTGMNTVKTRHFWMIHKELEKACAKHPKFCDFMTYTKKSVNSVGLGLLRKENSKGPYYADRILCEEIMEATEAYLDGDLEHCLQELAQCGAVILRMMQFVQDEMEAR